MSDHENTPLPEPGWYDDGTGQARWWDGQTWGAYQGATGAGAGPAKPTRRGGKVMLIVGIVLSLLVVLGGAAAIWAYFTFNPEFATVAKDAADAAADGDCDRFEELTTDDFREFAGYEFRCSDLKGFADEWSDYSKGRPSDGSFEVDGTGVTIEQVDSGRDWDTGWMTVEVSISLDENDPDSLERVFFTVTLEFVKEDGQWKIDSVRGLDDLETVFGSEF